MNAFASYADMAMPEPARRKAAREAKAPSALDLKMAEKQRLSRNYRAWKRKVVKATLASEPRLADFVRYLRTIDHARGAELIEAIADSWLPNASIDVRGLALRMVDARCDRINRGLGFAGLDDPLPPETSIYFQARDLLMPGGRA